MQQAEMPKYYAAADALVMPSLGDVWGLVCLEALLAGLPQVTSSFSGAAADLITSDSVGSIVDPRDEDAVACRAIRHTGPCRPRHVFRPGSVMAPQRCGHQPHSPTGRWHQFAAVWSRPHNRAATIQDQRASSGAWSHRHAARLKSACAAMP